MINILPAMQEARMRIEQDTGLEFEYSKMSADEDLLEELAEAFYSFFTRNIEVSDWNLNKRAPSINETMNIRESIVKEVLRKENAIEESLDDVADYVMSSCRFAESFLKVLSSMIIDKLPDLDPEKMDRFDGFSFMGKYGELTLYNALLEMNTLRTMDYENYDELGYFIHPRLMMSYLPENAIDILIESLTDYGEEISAEMGELDYIN